jgi:phytoene dehydrogenase-like protein
LEAGMRPREPREMLIALDPRLVAELRLPARGLSFVAHDLPLAVAGEIPILLGRDLRAAMAALACVSDADAEAWPRYQRLLAGEANRLRRWWSSGQGAAPQPVFGRAARQDFQRLCLTGADAFLAARFETPSLLAALLWDGAAGNLGVSEPGSALALVWRAAQAMGGLSGAAAIARPGTLIAALTSALGMAQLRTQSRVVRILTKAGGVTGVMLADGAQIEADHIVSALPRAQTLALAGLESAAPVLAEAKITLSLAAGFLPPNLPAAWHVLAERPEIYADAHEAARAGRVADDVPMAWAVLPDAIAVTVRPVPAGLDGAARTRLAAQTVLRLARALPGLAQAMTGVEIHLSPQRAALADLLAPPSARLITPVKGLLLAGADAEPLPSLSGRAGRLAAQALLTR